MKPFFLGVFLFGAAAGAAAAQEQIAAATPSPTATSASALSYEEALGCAVNYQLHAGEAEMQRLTAAKKARFASSDKASEQAMKVGGKTASEVEDEVFARLDKLASKPPSRTALTAAAKRCDGLLALTTP
jgi:hypothetical protein